MIASSEIDEPLPLDPLERRKVQNRNAQRKYRNRRNQQRVNQAAQGLPAKTQATLDQAIASPTQFHGHGPPPSGSWGWGQVQHPHSFTASMIPISMSEAQMQQAGYAAAGGVMPTQLSDISTQHAANMFDISYTTSESDLAAMSYLSMTGDSPLTTGESTTSYMPTAPLSTAHSTHNFNNLNSVSNAHSVHGSVSPPNIGQGLVRTPASTSSSPESMLSHSAPSHYTGYRPPSSGGQMSMYMRNPSSSTTLDSLHQSFTGNMLTQHEQYSKLQPPHYHSPPNSALMTKSGDPPSTSSFPQPEDEDNLPVLHIAAFRGHISIVKLLLGQSQQSLPSSRRSSQVPSPFTSSTPHPISTYGTATATGTPTTMSPTPALAAVATADGSGPVTNQVIDIAERDSSGRTALHLAAINGHAEVAQLLLSHAAALGQHRTILNAGDGSGKTPLHWAAQRRHERVLRLLVDSGADVNVTDARGWTALHAAIECG